MMTKQLRTTCCAFSTATTTEAKRKMAKKGLTIARVRGTRDLFPEIAEMHRGVVDTLQTVAQHYGFRQIQTPLLEYTNLFSRSLGDGTDIVMKEMYTFDDNSGKSVTLRPEGTVGVARALINNNIPLTPPQKLFYHGSMFRYERPQHGRYREFQQFGVEYINSAGASVDAEVIAMGAHALEKLGLNEKTNIQLNTLGSAECRDRYRVALEAYFLTHKHELSHDSVRRLERGSVLRILDSKSPVDQSIVAAAPRLNEYLSTQSLQRYDSVCRALAALGVSFTENPRLVRGLDYYSHTVFEFVESSSSLNDLKESDEPGQRGIAVLAGGCYDHLFESLGGPSAPCIGWAAGVDRLALLRTSGDQVTASSIAVVPVVAGSGLEKCDVVLHEALCAAQILRRRGFVVHFCHGHGNLNLKKQMKTADRYGCAYAVIVGGEEIQNRQVNIKNLVERQEVTLPWDTLTTFEFTK